MELEWLTTNPFLQFQRVEEIRKTLLYQTTSFNKSNPDVLAFQEVDSKEAIQKVVGIFIVFIYQYRSLSVTNANLAV